MSTEEFRCDDEFVERVRQARTMTPEQRVMEGFRLSEIAAEAAKARLRKEMPLVTEEEIIRELRIRRDEIERAERLGFTVINGRLKMRGD